MRPMKRTIIYLLITVFLFNGNAFALRPQSSQNRTGTLKDTQEPRTLSYGKSLKYLQRKMPSAELADIIRRDIKKAPHINTVKTLLDFITTESNYKESGSFSTLDYYSRLDFISDCFSIAFKRNDSQLVAEFLQLLQSEKSMLIEADRLLLSYLTVYSIDTPVKVSTVFAMYKGQNKIRPYSDNNTVGQDFLRKKADQLHHHRG